MPTKKPDLRTRPAAYSVACRACGQPVTYEKPPKNGLVECSCGVVNLVPTKEA